MRISIMLVGAFTLACAGRRGSQVPEPQTPNSALEQFLTAIKSGDRQRVAQLFGNKKGSIRSRGKLPAAYADSMIQVFEIYLHHDGYRIVAGPVPAIGIPDVVTYQVELQQPNCNHVQPFDLVHTDRGGWLVMDVHLEVAAQEVPKCRRQAGNPP
jgi:hypothetical protein